MTPPPRAVVFDLDDTLILDEELTRAAFAAAADAAASMHPGLDRKAFARLAQDAAEELFRSAPEYSRCHALGIAASELLWADFADPALASRAPDFRRAVFARALAGAGVSGDGQEEARAFARARLAGERLMPGAREVLEALRGRCKLGLLTNGDPGVQRGKLARCGLGPFFDAVVVSVEEGLGKPEPEIFQRVLARLGAEAEEAAMVGNSLARDVAGARAAGFAAAVWLKIPGAEEFAPVEPSHTLSRLEEVPRVLGFAAQTPTGSLTRL